MDIVTLISNFAGNLIRAEEKFWLHIDQFDDLEQEVLSISHQAAADFLSLVLSSVDEAIRNSGMREERYTIQRTRQRTLITTVGDVTFTHTLFKEKATGKITSLLESLIGLPSNERLSSRAEERLLSEAEVHSYQHAADSLAINGQTVTKETVMEKVHQVAAYLPEEGSVPQKEMLQILIHRSR